MKDYSFPTLEKQRADKLARSRMAGTLTGGRHPTADRYYRDAFRIIDGELAGCKEQARLVIRCSIRESVSPVWMADLLRHGEAMYHGKE